MMKYLIIVCFCGIVLSAEADYLKVSRSATLKAAPVGTAMIIDRVSEGETLFLLEESQTNGYYKAKHPNRGTVGYIYRTLVRRYEGTPPDYPLTTDRDMVSGDLKVHVLDIGPGLCTVIQLPDNRYVIYDAGHWAGYGNRVYTQIEEVVPAGSPIELFVLSHTDSDHMGAASQILEKYRVKKLLHTGYEKSVVTRSTTDESTGTYKRFTAALESLPYPIEDVNLNLMDSTILPGTTVNLGNARLVFLCGFGEPLPEWGIGSSDYSKLLNSVSIVMKLEYAGRSVLFGGDAVGRFEDKDIDPESPARATEAFLVQKAKEFLDSDVVIAPHHGADNGSSMEFIRETSPEYVIFSSGHDHEHPRQSAANRYLAYGVPVQNMLRTDRGDDEREADKADKEWAYGRIPGCTDSYGDDGVLITVSADGFYQVEYSGVNALCGEEQ